MTFSTVLSSKSAVFINVRKNCLNVAIFQEKANYSHGRKRPFFFVCLFKAHPDYKSFNPVL